VINDAAQIHPKRSAFGTAATLEYVPAAQRCPHNYHSGNGLSVWRLKGNALSFVIAAGTAKVAALD
jgi:hypothetical protein